MWVALAIEIALTAMATFVFGVRAIWATSVVIAVGILILSLVSYIDSEGASGLASAIVIAVRRWSIAVFTMAPGGIVGAALGWLVRRRLGISPEATVFSFSKLR